jgi:hypothetical protein
VHRLVHRDDVLEAKFVDIFSTHLQGADDLARLALRQAVP